MSPAVGVDKPVINRNNVDYSEAKTEAEAESLGESMIEIIRNLSR